jgi:hypothetical protein
MMPPQMPEMAKKTAAIMALRMIHQQRFSTDDLKAALPILKQIRDAEKALEAQSNEALDEEKRALLAARPDSPPPPGAGEKMEAAHRKFAESHQRGWESLHRAIGDEKAGLLQGFVGQGPGMMDPFGGPMGPGPGGPGLQPGQPRPGRGPRAGRGPAVGAPDQPGGPPQFGAPPQQPGDGFQAGQFAPGAGVSPPAVGIPAVPGDGDPFQAPPQGVRPGQQFPGAGGPQGLRPGQQRFRNNNPFGGPMPGAGGMPGGGPHMSLSELIDLLSQKLTAMGK